LLAGYLLSSGLGWLQTKSVKPAGISGAANVREFTFSGTSFASATNALAGSQYGSRTALGGDRVH
jgi:hypothetical protein